MPKFSYSLKKQQVNARKVYSIDTGFVSTNSGSFTKDLGRKFENLVSLHLRRKYSDIYYFSDNRECDFIVSNRGKIDGVVQVCYDLNQGNLDRELSGLLEAMKTLNTGKGIIVTPDQEDCIIRDEKEIEIVNWKYFLE